MSYYDLHLLIAGEKIHAHERDTLDVINPADEQVLGQLPMATSADIERALTAADDAFRGWRKTPPPTSRDWLKRPCVCRLDQRSHSPPGMPLP